MLALLATCWHEMPLSTFKYLVSRKTEVFLFVFLFFGLSLTPWKEYSIWRSFNVFVLSEWMNAGWWDSASPGLSSSGFKYANLTLQNKSASHPNLISLEHNWGLVSHDFVIAHVNLFLSPPAAFKALLSDTFSIFPKRGLVNIIFNNLGLYLQWNLSSWSCYSSWLRL